MKAIYIDGHGGNEVVHIGPRPAPQRQAGEVLVRMSASTLNQVDLYMRNSGAGITHTLPQTMGLDGAGVVEEVDADEPRWKPGQRVVLHPGVVCGRCEFCLRGEGVHAVGAQGLRVAHGRGVLPHLAVHRGRDHERAFARDAERREQVVGQPVGELGEKVGGCRRDDDRVRRPDRVEHARRWVRGGGPVVADGPDGVAAAAAHPVLLEMQIAFATLAVHEDPRRHGVVAHREDPHAEIERGGDLRGDRRERRALREATGAQEVDREVEVAQTEPAALRREAAELLASMGQSESGLHQLARIGFGALGLQTYLTAGPKEARAWTIKKGWTAPQAAGVIHTDFQRGFIKAEIVSFDDLVAAGSMNAAKAAGRVRMEGKEYVMRDGDVVEFRFNV